MKWHKIYVLHLCTNEFKDIWAKFRNTETLNIYANVVMIGRIQNSLQGKHLPNFVREATFQFAAWTMA